ncbi:MAG: cytochrome C [Nitrospirae bacterium]|nr:cytochrome C [Nitrospirota bacterium]
MAFFKFFVVIAVAVLLPLSAFAAGGHDGLVCTGCHSIHVAKDSIIFAVSANKSDVNPKTKQQYTEITALCLGCHQAPDKGGMGIKPIAGHMSHPYGTKSINSKVARVPDELVRDGKFDCIGCHDPHPSNTYYRYLRTDTANGSKMDSFCAVCHPMKADPKVAGQRPSFFDSMNEKLFGSMTGTSSEAPIATKSEKTKKK